MQEQVRKIEAQTPMIAQSRPVRVAAMPDESMRPLSMAWRSFEAIPIAMPPMIQHGKGAQQKQRARMPNV